MAQSAPSSLPMPGHCGPSRRGQATGSRPQGISRLGPCLTCAFSRPRQTWVRWHPCSKAATTGTLGSSAARVLLGHSLARKRPRHEQKPVICTLCRQRCARRPLAEPGAFDNTGPATPAAFQVGCVPRVDSDRSPWGACTTAVAAGCPIAVRRVDGASRARAGISTG